MEGPRRHRQRGRVREAPEERYETAEQPSPGVLLDSDIIIEVLRGRARIVGTIAALEGRGVPTYCCAVSWAEVFAGVRPGEEPVTEAFFQARGEVILDSTVGRRAGAYLARFARSHGVEIADALVGAAASVSGLRLWTLNRKHYPMSDIRFHDS